MRTTHVCFLLVAGALLLFSACGTSSQSSSQGGDPDFISAEQMESAAERHNTAHSVVENLRPLWLRKRGQNSIENPSDIVVYVDGSRYGTPDVLHQILANDVASMEFLSPAEATNRYGTGHAHGAILVNSKDSL